MLLCVLSFAPVAVAETLFGTQAGTIGAGNLYTINTGTGAATLVGPLVDGSGNHYGMTGIAFQPGTGVLFGSTSRLSPTSRPLRIMCIDSYPAIVFSAPPTDRNQRLAAIRFLMKRDPVPAHASGMVMVDSDTAFPTRPLASVPKSRWHRLDGRPR